MKGVSLSTNPIHASQSNPFLHHSSPVRPSVHIWLLGFVTCSLNNKGEEPLLLLLCIVIARRRAFSIIMLGGSKPRRAWLNP